MAKSKMENAAMLDPQRFEIAKSMSVVPGGPMNNNPMNVTSIDQQLSSLSGVNQYPYGDSGMVQPQQMGGVYPMQNSGQPGNMVTGTGKNKIPYGTQQQPQYSAADPMEGMRLGMDAMNRGLMSSQYMGMIGMGVETTTPLPGGSIPSPQQTNATLGLQGMQNAEMAAGGVNMTTGQRSA